MAVDGGVAGAVLQVFAEREEVAQLLVELPRVVCDLSGREHGEERFRVILDRYLEQPHLLDPHLGDVVSQLLAMAREQPLSPLSHQAFRYLYLVTKVRGAKAALQWFSHEVADLDPVLELLESQDPGQHETWETRYVLLLWLSIIAIVPFGLCLVDGEQQSHHPTLNRILALGQHYLLQTDKCKDAAALLLSRVLTRRDVQGIKLAEFLEWCKGKLCSSELESVKGIAAASGVLAVLASLFKLSKREEMEEYGPAVLQWLKSCNVLNSSNYLLRKLSIKLAQRVGMVFLPARVASWRYRRGLRSLSDTLSALPQTSASQAQEQVPANGDDDDWEVREEVEEVVEILLSGLHDCVMVVRWSAAKGIGRVTSRLPRSLADDVLQSVLTCFSAREGDGAWHGGCLAVAELGRRGLVLPERLCDVVPSVQAALAYDEMRGTHSVGAHVRDAACYVCWSFARAYEPQQLRPYVSKLASCLVITALFDREVNCRRAAAAAFQENVGRQGTFPHGIDILTSVDYFAVGSRSNAYVNLSVYVAQFSEYTQPLIDHLVEIKLSHWDSSLRQLAAQALHQLTPHLPDYILASVLPKLLPQVLVVDPRLSHGALLAVTEVVASLQSLKCSSISAVLGEEIVQQLLGLMPQPLLLSKQEAAVAAFHAVSSTYYTRLSPDHSDTLIENYLTGLSSSLSFTRMGYCLALGALPRPLLSRSLGAVLQGLVGVVSDIDGCDPQFTESRRDAVRSISSVCKTMGVGGAGLAVDAVDTIFKTLALALNDYTTDARGDIGVVVREAAMTAATEIFQVVASGPQPEMAAPHTHQIVNLMLQQANGIIDRTRALACSKLQLLLHCKPPLKGIPHHSHLASIFQEYPEKQVNWAVASTTFPLTVPLLALPEYTYHTLLGVVTSCGGLGESTVRDSRAAVLHCLREFSGSVEMMELFSTTLLEVFKRNGRNTRITQPLLVTVDLLLSNGVFDIYLQLTEHTFPKDLLMLVKEEVAQSSDAKKLMAAANVYCGLLQFPAVRVRSLNRIMLLLCHKFPIVRRGAADQLYASIVTYDDVIPEELVEEASSILTETKWDEAESLEVARKGRNCLCDLLGLNRPVKVATGAKPGVSSVGDEMASYRDLVDRAGY